MEMEALNACVYSSRLPGSAVFQAIIYGNPKKKASEKGALLIFVRP